MKNLQTFDEFINESKTIVPNNKIKVGNKGTDYIDEPGTIVYITDDIDDTKLHKYDSNGIISQIGSDIKDGAIDKNSTFVAVKLNDGDTTIYVYGEEGFKVTK